MAELFTEGLISHRVCAAIAQDARSWGVLSTYKLEKAIDAALLERRLLGDGSRGL